MVSEHQVRLIEERLNLDALVARVSSSAAGAVVTFSGTTRDSFQGKRVVRLEYEAYVPMAVKVLETICQEAATRWSLLGLTVEHRLGLVPVGETSVIVAAASAHRRDAIEAMHYVIDELKLRAPIFKKEVYEDGSAWKANCSH